MSSRPGTVISRRCTSSSSRVGVSKASAFRFVSRAVCSSYTTLNLRRPNFSSRRRSDLEQSSAARHIYAVTSRLLHSLEDIFLRTVLFIILLSCLRSDIVILDPLIVFTYLLTALSRSKGQRSTCKGGAHCGGLLYNLSTNLIHDPSVLGTILLSRDYDMQLPLSPSACRSRTGHSGSGSMKSPSFHDTADDR